MDNAEKRLAIIGHLEESAIGLVAAIDLARELGMTEFCFDIQYPLDDINIVRENLKERLESEE